MDELPPRARSLIERARDAHDPEPADRVRVRSALAVAIGKGGPAQGSDAAGGDAAAGGSAAATSSGVGAKLALGVVAVATVGALFVTRPWQAEPDPTQASRQAPRPAAPAVAPTERAAPPSEPPAATKSVVERDEGSADEPSREAAVVSPEAQPAVQAEATQRLDDEPSPVARKRERRSQRPVAAETSKHAAAQTKPSESSAAAATEVQASPLAAAPEAESEPALADAPPQPEPAPAVRGAMQELALIRAATRALRDGRAGDALASVTAHAARFPQGVLRQEREGLRVLTTCALGRTAQAQRLRARFLDASPDSPMAERVRAACAPNEE
jgi:hypothetical protein